MLKGTAIGGLSDETGHYFLKDMPVGRQTLVFSCVGYVTEERTVDLMHDQTLELNVNLHEESLMMDGVVVTANKYATKRREAANIVNAIPPVLFENTSAHSMADVLGFQTGLRMEQTCTNSGVLELRINDVTAVSDLVLRLTYASGYRTPQAYDEGLHVGAVGGEVSLISLAPDLKPEHSHSLSGSADLYHRFGLWETNLTLEGFYTRLNDVFALVENGHDQQVNLLLTRVNSDGAYVAGVNLEAKLAYRKLLLLQGGYTVQRSRYTEDFALSEAPSIAPQRRMFRTPGNYGYFLISSTPLHDFTIAVNGMLTGRKLVQHDAGYVAIDEETLTDRFFELGVKLS